jgi:hypothetical protein
VQKSDRIRSLVKEWIKTGEDRLSDELENLLHNAVNSEGFQVFSPRILERYKNGSVSLHFHISESLCNPGVIGMVEGHSDVAKYCAVAEFFLPEKHGDYCASSSAPLHSGVIRYGGHQVERLVFVKFVEIGHLPEKIIPTRIRLQSLDDCLRLVGHPIKTMSSDLIREGFGTGADRELVLNCVHGGAVNFDKLPNEMVKGGSNIEQVIPDHRTERIGGFGKMNAKEHQIAFRILLGNNLAFSVVTGSENLVYSYAMFICPDQFALG